MMMDAFARSPQIPGGVFDDLLRELDALRAQAVLSAALAGYLSPFREESVADPIDPRDLAPDQRRRLKNWPIIDRAITYLQEQELADPQAVANLIRTSTIVGRGMGAAANARLTADLNRALQESVAAGEGARDWAKRMRSVIGTRSAYEETLSRTATHNAYIDGQRKVASGPAGNRFPYRQYRATKDTRVRDSHEDMDGKVYHKDSPMAKIAAQRLAEWNCRCNERMLTRRQAERLGIDDDTGWVPPEVPEIKPAQPESPTPVVPPTAAQPSVERTTRPAPGDPIIVDQERKQEIEEAVGITDLPPVVQPPPPKAATDPTPVTLEQLPARTPTEKERARFPEETRVRTLTAPVQELARSVEELDDEHREVLREYADDVLDTRSINAEFRAGRMPSGTLAQQFALLNAAIQAARITRDIVLYRGVQVTPEERQQLLDAMQPGAIVSMRGLTSTSLNPEVAASYTDENGVIFEIRAKSGAYISPLSWVDRLARHQGAVPQDEVLLPDDKKYRVIAIQRDVHVGARGRKGTGRTVVQLEEVS